MPLPLPPSSRPVSRTAINNLKLSRRTASSSARQRSPNRSSAAAARSRMPPRGNPKSASATSGGCIQVSGHSPTISLSTTLPLELVRYIFEYAYADYSSALAVTLVYRRAYTLAAPALHRATLVTHRSSCTPPRLPAARGRNAGHVRALFIQKAEYAWAAKQATRTRFFTACTGLHALGVESAHQIRMEYYPLARVVSLYVQRFSNLGVDERLVRANTLGARLTHLQLDSLGPDHFAHAERWLSLLPCLTHLALDLEPPAHSKSEWRLGTEVISPAGTTTTRIVRTLLAPAPHITMLVLFVDWPAYSARYSGEMLAQQKLGELQTAASAAHSRAFVVL